MIRKLFAGMLMCALLGSAAMGEVCMGVTAAHHTVAVVKPAGKTPAEVNVLIGQTVRRGDVLASLKTEKVFSTQEGTIARVLHDAGDTVNGDVLEISPLSRYTVHCTVSDGYAAVKNRTVHIGEKVYMRCTKNGTHWASGIITSIDGTNYMVETTGGELYIGETVYLFRYSDMKTDSWIGNGTVVESDTEKYSASGCIAEMHVSEGEYVERGQLLYTIVPKTGAELTAPVDGIVYSLAEDEGGCTESAAVDYPAATQDLAPGTDSAEDVGEDVFAVIVPSDGICIEVIADESQLGNIHTGDPAYIIYAADAGENAILGIVEEISRCEGTDGYTVWINPERSPERIGLHAEVHIGEKLYR